MKPALILGLALAANAIAADSENNELFVAPQGRLAELAKKYPGMIMFDEQADDELSLGGIRPRIGNDDEFCGRYKYRFRTEQEYHKFCAQVMEEYRKADLRASRIWKDDELHAVNKPKEGIRRFIPPNFDEENRTWKMGAPQPAYFDDDELVAVKIPKEKFPTQEAFRKHQVSLSEDELWSLWGSNQPDQHASSIRIPSWQMNNEFLASIQNVPTDKDDQNIRTIRIPSWVIANDDEITFDELFGSHSTIIVPSWQMQDDEIDLDELFGLNQSGQNTTIKIPSWTMHFDGETDDNDDELVYLGQLLNEKVQSKVKEGTQMKRKLRPVDGASLAQN